MTLPAPIQSASFRNLHLMLFVPRLGRRWRELWAGVVGGVFLTSCAWAQGVAESVYVPLPIYQFSSTGAEYKVGIQLTLGQGGTTSTQLYEFDTGGTGFFAGSGTAAGTSWGNTATGMTVSATYASGNTYNANVVNTNVTFDGAYNSSGTVALTASGTGDGVQVALITSATNPDKGPDKPINNFTPSINAGIPPLDTFFYGDFGMSLTSNSGLSAIVGQLPGGLSNGYVVSVGSYPTVTGTGPALVQTGTLRIGLTSADLNPANWTTILMMSGSGSGVYPVSGQSMYDEVLTTGTLTISGTTNLGTTSTTSVASGVVFDTGAPTTTIHTGSDGYTEIGQYLTDSGTGSVITGDTVTLIGDPDQGALSGTMLAIAATGTDAGLNLVNTSTANAINYDGFYTNTGLNIFFGNEVVFNLQDGWIGIRAAGVPEPGAIALGGLGLAALAGWRILRRRPNEP